MPALYVGLSRVMCACALRWFNEFEQSMVFWCFFGSFGEKCELVSKMGMVVGGGVWGCVRGSFGALAWFLIMGGLGVLGGEGRRETREDEKAKGGTDEIPMRAERSGASEERNQRGGTRWGLLVNRGGCLFVH